MFKESCYFAEVNKILNHVMIDYFFLDNSVVVSENLGLLILGSVSSEEFEDDNHKSILFKTKAKITHSFSSCSPSA